MAVVPNLWGLWNMAYLALRPGRTVPLGAFGALLPLLLVPLGIFLARTFGVHLTLLGTGLLLPFVAVAMTADYLVWKYIVGFLNREMGIA